MKKIIVILTVLTLLAVGGGYLYGKSVPKIPPAADSRAQQSISQTSAPKTVVEFITVPSKLLIPKLEIEAQIESVGLDAERKMDVPSLAQNVAWYNLGVKPGEKGNAVVAGHLDTITGETAVFHNLNSLTTGDIISVISESNQTFSYKVTEIKTYEVKEFPLDEVFGTTNKYRLNLITCSGQFDNSSYNYSHRTVVYSELVQ